MKYCITVCLLLCCLFVAPVHSFALDTFQDCIDSLETTEGKVAVTPKSGLTATLIVAGYQENGKMVFCQVKALSRGESVLLEKREADQICMFLLSADNKPICNKFVWNGEDFKRENYELPTIPI